MPSVVGQLERRFKAMSFSIFDANVVDLERYVTPPPSYTSTNADRFQRHTQRSTFEVYIQL